MGKKISDRHSIKRIQNEQSKKACRILYFPKFNLRDYRRAGRVAISTIPVAYGGDYIEICPMMFYTEAETAGILRVSPRTLQRWRELGAGPAFTQPRKGGRMP